MGIKFIISILIFFLPLFGKTNFIVAQNYNLVPNPSFEEQQGCGIFSGNFCGGYWYNPTSSSPDWIDTCLIGYFNPQMMVRTGGGRVGCFLYQSPFMDGREYIAVALKNVLKNNTKYCFSIYVSLSKGYKYGTNNLGVYFGNGHQLYNTFATIPVSPQIEMPSNVNITNLTSWYKFEGNFIASGIETDIVIGGFKTDLQSTLTFVCDSFSFPGTLPVACLDASYLVFEDVSVHEIFINAGNDTTICDTSNSFLTIGELNLDTAFKAYYWYDVNNNLIDSTHSTITVNPQASTAYTLKKELCETLYDTVNITVLNCKGEEIHFEVPNVFTPNGDGINDNLEIKIGNADLKVFEIYNRWGNLILKSETNNLTTKTITWSGRTTSGIECSDGVYYYVIKAKDKNGKDLNQKGFITLAR